MKVRLKQTHIEAIVPIAPSFNSMKVRLRLGQVKMSSRLVEFQFHEGPIKTFLATTV